MMTPGMLDRLVGIKHRTNATDTRAHRVTDHFVQPVPMDDFQIIVEQPDDFSGGRVSRRGC